MDVSLGFLNITGVCSSVQLFFLIAAQSIARRPPANLPCQNKCNSYVLCIDLYHTVMGSDCISPSLLFIWNKIMHWNWNSKNKIIKILFITHRSVSIKTQWPSVWFWVLVKFSELKNILYIKVWLRDSNIYLFIHTTFLSAWFWFTHFFTHKYKTVKIETQINI